MTGETDSGAARRPAGVTDKPVQHGHQAFYLSGRVDSTPPDVETLRTLAAGARLGAEEQAIVAELIDSRARTSQLPYSWTPQEQHFLDRHPREDWLPYLIYRFRFRVLPWRRQLSEMPVHLLIEPASACNLRCPMCFQTDQSFTRKPYMGVMDMGLYRDVIDQAAEGGVGAVSLGSRGEPFMNRHFGAMLRYAAERKAFYDLKINTNATRMDERGCHDILASGVNVIVLSIDAHEKDLYERIRVRAKYETVLENVRRLRAIRDRDYPDSSAEIRVSGVYFHAEQDEAAFRAFWSEICDTVVYVRAQQRWDTYGNPRHPEKTTPCLFLWERLYVWWDGQTNPCDEDYKSMLSPGNAKNERLRDIWHGEALTRLRDMHMAARRADAVPCDRCGV